MEQNYAHVLNKVSMLDARYVELQSELCPTEHDEDSFSSKMQQRVKSDAMTKLSRLQAKYLEPKEALQPTECDFILQGNTRISFHRM